VKASKVFENAPISPFSLSRNHRPTMTPVIKAPSQSAALKYQDGWCSVESVVVPGAPREKIAFCGQKSLRCRPRHHHNFASYPKKLFTPLKYMRKVTFYISEQNNCQGCGRARFY